MRQLKTQPISVENGGLIQIAYCEMRFEETADWNHAETLNEGKVYINYALRQLIAQPPAESDRQLKASSVSHQRYRVAETVVDGGAVRASG
jgi:hypothetical protein